MHRFFCQDYRPGDTWLQILSPQELRHLKTVLRLKQGAQITIFNGQGDSASAQIIEIGKSHVNLSVDQNHSTPRKSTHVILACAVPKKSKFEFIIEKCTELGVDEILPLRTERTEVIISLDKSYPKQQRYQTVAVNAAKQSRRDFIPQIHPQTAFADSLGMIKKGNLAIIPCLKGSRKEIHEVLTVDSIKNRTLICFIGPEGDFTHQEIDAAIKQGCVPVTLGDTILKVDTAAISLMAFVNFIKSNAH